jgi:hypothetical protein
MIGREGMMRHGDGDRMGGDDREKGPNRAYRRSNIIVCHGAITGPGHRKKSQCFKSNWLRSRSEISMIVSN